jgi:hypothetical protein
MGIFVSSRMMDGFAIESCGLRFDPNEASTPLARFEWIDVNAALKPSQVQTVVLDFEGVAHVGQAFVDEVFRVFATAHPHVRLKTMGITPEVAKLVRLFGRA